MNRATLLLIIPAILSLAVFLTPVHADISYTGQLDPADPADWDENTDGYVGKTENGTLTVNGGSALKSHSGSIGYSSSSSGTVTLHGSGSTWTNSTNLSVGYHGKGAMNITDGAAMNSGDVYIGDTPISTGTVTVDGDGSSWTNYGIFYIARDGIGMLTIINGGDVSSSSGYIGQTYGSIGEVTVKGAGSTWTDIMNLCVGNYGSGTLSITDGATVNNTHGCIGTRFGSTGEVTVDGDGSTWTNSYKLSVGTYGIGTLNITGGGAVSNSYYGYIGEMSGSTGEVTVDGTGSTWTNDSLLYVGKGGNGTLHVSGGGSVTATEVSINNKSLLAIDIGYGSSLSINGGSGTIDNDGAVRILAGAGVAADDPPYSPISAGTWSGSGAYQAVGGTWDEDEHEFTVSAVVSGDAGEQFSILTNTNQRALIADDGEGGTGWSLGASFLHKTGDYTELLVTATAVEGDSLTGLQALLNTNADVLGAWDIELAGDGYTEDDPVYLSFAVGDGYKRGDLLVWHFDGSEWTPFDAMDLTVNDGWASFTATEFSGYAVSTVPEPGTLVLMLVAGLGLLVFHRVGRGRMNFGGAAQTNQP